MKKLILISLIFLSLTSCSKKDDVIEPTQPINWYVGNYSSDFAGGDVNVEYKLTKMYITMTFDFPEPNPDVIDTIMVGEDLLYSDMDSVVFYVPTQEYNTTLYRDLSMKVGPDMSMILTRID